MSSRINSPKVIHQIFDTEVVVVNLETGNYYSVTGSGIAVWQRLDAGVSTAEIIELFVNNGEADQVRAFLKELEREELILPNETTEARTGQTLPPGGSFVPPRLEKFSDMRELLLVDPIHELDESGWPKPPPLQEDK